LPQWIHLF